jgi:dephospho-CoA kinase
MKIIGLLGGVASGKSAVAGLFCELGAAVLDADRAGHEALRRPEIIEALRNRWGNSILGQDGQIDRPAVAKIVFAPDPQASTELAFLEGLTHPLITEALSREIERLSAEAAHPAAILDAPVLLKAGWDRFCDHLVFVDVPRNQRLSRAIVRGWSDEQFIGREAAQEPLPEKRARCDTIINNSGSLEETRRQVSRFWDSLILRRSSD